MKIWKSACLAAVTVIATIGSAEGGSSNALTIKEKLGRAIFFDTALSRQRNQSCASCHAPEAGWTGPISAINATGAVYEGSVAGRFGNRKPPSAAYATPSPVLHVVEEDGETLFVGGNFWDGRATGEKLGIPAADQAQGPFLNPVEQALSDAACVVRRICTGKYSSLMESVWPGNCDIQWPAGMEGRCASGQSISLNEATRAKVDTAYDNIAGAIAAFEASPQVNSYTSKFDAWQAGAAKLTGVEQRGFELFTGKAQCAACHVIEPGPNGEPPLFTDFTFDNLGVPANPENPWYTQTAYNDLGADWIDIGLGGFLATRPDYADEAKANLGKQKVPTLRNVATQPSRAFTKAFMHNGYFKTLKGLVHFYNTRDALPACANPRTTEAVALKQKCWPAPEVATNVNDQELGNLGLTEGEERAIVKFMETLSDGYWTGQ